MERIISIISVIFLVSGFPELSNADPVEVTILDSYYHIWGSGEATNTTNTNTYYFNYDQSGNSPTVFDYLIDDPWLKAYDQAFDFGLLMYNSANMGGSDNDVVVEWEFQPAYDFDQLNFEYTCGYTNVADARIYIEDLTAGLVVADIDCNAYVLYPPFPPEITTVHDFLADHVYRLNLHGYTQERHDSHYLGLKADMVSVPEPSTMFLLAFGLIGLAGVKRKSQKR